MFVPRGGLLTVPILGDTVGAAAFDTRTFGTFGRPSDFDPRIMVALQDTQEWDKLVCWICVIWIASPPYPDGISRNLEDGMLLLFRQRPDSIQSLKN